MKTTAYICSWTAWRLWHRIRCTRRPRLDQTETVMQELRRRGVRPASIRALSRAVPAPGPDDLLSRMQRASTDIQALLLGTRTSPLPDRQGESAATAGSASPDDTADSMLAGKPIDLLVPEGAARRNTLARVCHVWSGPVPYGAFVPLGKGMYLSTPEFLFVQLAAQLDMPRLMLLGFELCGFYATERGGCPSQKRCQPLTSPDRLRGFVEGIDGARGVKRARRSVRFAVGGSGSPMESAMVALACMPRAYGGYGLPLPQMNPRIDVPLPQRELLGRTWVACDAFWPAARFALEYDGREDHEGSANVARDHARANDLMTLGIAVETVDAATLYDLHRFDKVVRKAAKRIGYRLDTRGFGTAWHRKRSELRADILG